MVSGRFVFDEIPRSELFNNRGLLPVKIMGGKKIIINNI